MAGKTDYNSCFINTLITSLRAMLMSICSRGGREVVKDTIIKMETQCEIHGKGVYMLPVNYRITVTGDMHNGVLENQTTDGNQQ